MTTATATTSARDPASTATRHTDVPTFAAPPAPVEWKNLRFQPQRMVRWFEPAQLVRTGVNALLSSVFGAFADKREMEAALGAARLHDGYVFDSRGEFWFDFVADTGDGFYSTYTVAYLLGRPDIVLKDGDERIPTRRGRLLVMGGDQVYPLASAAHYENRLYGPFEASFPFHQGGDHPHLYAIPGNHDWYDGLVSFLRLFCQRRWIGAWETQQSRSYFAVKLPGRWSLWGVDVQLQADIDKPQIDFFCNIAKSILESGGPGERIILCTAEPSWIETAWERRKAYDRLAFFEREVIAENGAKLVLTLTGDLHHYARYEETATASPQHKITAGGGGAYLYPTHHLPKELKLDVAGATRSERRPYVRRKVYPTAARSLLLTLGALRFPVANPGFGAVLGVLYLVYFWLLETASRRFMPPEVVRPCGGDGAGLMEQIGACHLAQWNEVLRAGFYTLVFSPAPVAMTVLVIVALAAFGSSGWRGNYRRIGVLIGFVHGVVHVALSFALLWGIWVLNIDLLGFTTGTSHGSIIWWQVLAYVIEMLVGAALCGGVVMGGYLVVCNVFKMHDNETFSSQAISGYKNFLRLKLDRATDTLTVYAAAIPRACRRWRPNPAGGGAPLIIPRHGDQIDVDLIEKIVVGG